MLGWKGAKKIGRNTGSENTQFDRVAAKVLKIMRLVCAVQKKCGRRTSFAKSINSERKREL
jgi:hypothetical protein